MKSFFVVVCVLGAVMLCFSQRSALLTLKVALLRGFYRETENRNRRVSVPFLVVLQCAQQLKEIAAVEKVVLVDQLAN